MREITRHFVELAFVVVISIAVASCGSVLSGTYYNKLTADEKKKFIVASDSLGNFTENQDVFIINSEKLTQFQVRSGKGLLIHTFQPACSHLDAMSFNGLQEFARSNAGQVELVLLTATYEYWNIYDLAKTVPFSEPVVILDSSYGLNARKAQAKLKTQLGSPGKEKYYPDYFISKDGSVIYRDWEETYGSFIAKIQQKM